MTPFRKYSLCAIISAVGFLMCLIAAYTSPEPYDLPVLCVASWGFGFTTGLWLIAWSAEQ